MGETQTEFLSGNLEWEHMRESHLMEGNQMKLKLFEGSHYSEDQKLQLAASPELTLSS